MLAFQRIGNFIFFAFSLLPILVSVSRVLRSVIFNVDDSENGDCKESAVFTFSAAACTTFIGLFGSEERS